MSASDTPDRSRREWLARLNEIGRAHGFFERVGQRHMALYVQEGSTLLVSFDQAERVYANTADGLPLGFEAVQKREWSLLNIMASGQTFFRDAELYRFFDSLVDQDFFDSFDRVIFLGAGPMCGYAACAYSVASPGARVLALNPVATLDREDAPFEMRFRRARRMNFRDRYGFAPFMLEGASQATVVFDPYDPLGAAHAALFRASNVQRIPVRWSGADLLGLLSSGGAIYRLLYATARGKLTPLRFAEITRNARRDNPGYLTRLMTRAIQKGRPALARRVAEHGAKATGATVFARQLEALGPAPQEPPSEPARVL